MGMDVSIDVVGENAIVVVSYDDGESPRAYTISEVRDWLNEPIEVDVQERFDKATIIDKLLERVELDLINPVK